MIAIGIVGGLYALDRYILSHRKRNALMKILDLLAADKVAQDASVAASLLAANAQHAANDSAAGAQTNAAHAVTVRTVLVKHLAALPDGYLATDGILYIAADAGLKVVKPATGDVDITLPDDAPVVPVPAPVPA